MKKIILIKWFPGKAITGGEMVYDAVERACLKIPGTIVNHPFDKKEKIIFQKNFPFSFLSRRLYIFFLTGKFRKEGKVVFSGLNSGTINYVQPPAEKKLSNWAYTFNQLYYNLVEWIVNLQKKPLEIVVYNSNYTKEKFKVDALKELILHPPLTADYGFNYSEKEDLILCISRIDQNKNLDLLGELSGKINHEVILAGFLPHKGEQYLEHLRLKYPKLKIMTNVTEGNKTNMLRKAKVLVMPSEAEPFGIVKLEAMVAGAVPIVHNSGGAPEAIPSGLTFSNAEELLEKVKGVLSTYNLTFAEKIRNMALKHNIDSFEEKIRDIFISLSE